MRLISNLVLGLMLATAAHSQSAARKDLTVDQYRMIIDDREYWRQQSTRYRDIQTRAWLLIPQRRNSPLRELNISDDEVREVQVLAALYLPRELVNISPVVTNCPCEEGPTCTAQVYVLATGKGRTKGLQLSRMNQTWQVGIVQGWWLKHEALKQQDTGNKFLDEYREEKARNELLEEFPVCVGQLVPATQTAAAKKPEGKK
jgi:hypothetical protein